MTQIVPDTTSSLTGKWKPYPAYKDSGVEWIGEIPKYWHLEPLKRITSFISRGSSPEYVDQSSIAVINQACVYWDGLRVANIKYQNEENVAYSKALLQSDDLLINSTGTGTLGRAIIFDHPETFIADSHITIVRVFPENVCARYLFYLVQSPIYQGYIYAVLVSGSTNQVELSKEGLRVTAIIIPPLSEQRAIAAFLNRETAKIKALIAKKERLIELLQEKRAALISYAVTKGLDPTVPMKDSGVEWLGEIPAHWKVKRLKNVINNSLTNGLFKKKDQFGSGVKLVNVVDMYRDNFVIDFESLDRVEADQEECEAYKVSSGDIFFVRSSLKLEGVGASASIFEVPEPTVFECHVVRIRPSMKQILSTYLINYLNSTLVRQQLVALAGTTTMTTIAQPKLASLEVVVPPISEQQAIATYLEFETAKIDMLISKIREGIEKLKEYRAALISAAVTGKIDVRGEIAAGDIKDI